MDKRVNEKVQVNVKGKTSYKILKRYAFRTVDGYITDIQFRDHTAAVKGYMTVSGADVSQAWGTDSKALADDIISQTNLIELVDTWEEGETE